MAVTSQWSHVMRTIFDALVHLAKEGCYAGVEPAVCAQTSTETSDSHSQVVFVSTSSCSPSMHWFRCSHRSLVVYGILPNCTPLALGRGLPPASQKLRLYSLPFLATSQGTKTIS